MKYKITIKDKKYLVQAVDAKTALAAVTDIHICDEEGINVSYWLNKGGISSEQRSKMSSEQKYAKAVELRENSNVKSLSNVQRTKNETYNNTNASSKHNSIQITTDIKTFMKRLNQFANSHTLDDKWRVSLDYSQDDYADMELFMNDDAVYAIHRGDIVSVCVNPHGKTRGKQLLKEAVQNGGDRLDAFESLFGFYTKCGFEPVSWVEFDEQYAPDGWRKGIDKPEKIIFYRYTGTPYTESIETFISATPKSTSYDDAKKVRDNLIGD